MNQTVTILVSVIVFTVAIAAFEATRQPTDPSPSQSVSAAPTRLRSDSIRAPGRIAGLTEEVELRSQITETIEQIHVSHGDRVGRGDLLISLDDDLLEQEKEIATAVLMQRQSELERLENGARSSEIEIARAELVAIESQLTAATLALQRARKLTQTRAISQQEYDNTFHEVANLQATRHAAKKRLEKISEPARAEDIQAAVAAVRAAKAKLIQAKEQLDRTQLRAPSEGTVLRVDAQVGELSQPTSQQPIIVLCNTDRPRAILEVDEFDALRVKLGQRCELTSDGSDGVIAVGEVTEIEPSMARKKVFGQFAGERNDTFSRRVWVDLDSNTKPLPIGLPIRAKIVVSPAKSP